MEGLCLFGRQSGFIGWLIRNNHLLGDDCQQAEWASRLSHRPPKAISKQTNRRLLKPANLIFDHSTSSLVKMPLIHQCIRGRNFLLLICTFLIIAHSISAMRQQAVAVKGILLCGGRPASGVKVKLWDEDDGPDPDDVLDEGYTDGSGSFSLRGSTRELTTIDPVLKVYHDCDDGILPGQRKVKLRIPNQYISSGGVARRQFDIGVLNLETRFGGEERDLI